MDPELEPVFSENPQCSLQAETAGFTLVELLVSVAILATLAVAATLALPRAAPPAEADMALFRSQFETARSLAITGRNSRGLYISRQTLRPAQRRDEGWQPGRRTLRWRGQVAFVPGADQTLTTAPDAPQIQFLASGRTSAFDIRFGPGHHCQSDGWTGLTCRP